MHLVAEIALSVLLREARVRIDRRDLALRNRRPFGVSLDAAHVDERTLFYEKPLFIKLLTYGGKQVVKQLALARRPCGNARKWSRQGFAQGAESRKTCGRTAGPPALLQAWRPINCTRSKAAAP